VGDRPAIARRPEHHGPETDQAVALGVDVVGTDLEVDVAASNTICSRLSMRPIDTDSTRPAATPVSWTETG
jgi:hypothetical protein